MWRAHRQPWMKKRPQRLVFIDEIADHGQEKRIGQMLIGLMSQRNDNTDRFGAPQPQATSAYIGMKMVLAGQFVDPVAGRLVDQIAAGQRS